MEEQSLFRDAGGSPVLPGRPIPFRCKALRPQADLESGCRSIENCALGDQGDA